MKVIQFLSFWIQWKSIWFNDILRSIFNRFFGSTNAPLRMILLNEINKIRQLPIQNKKNISKLCHVERSWNIYKDLCHAERSRSIYLVDLINIIWIDSSTPITLRTECIRTIVRIVANHHKIYVARVYATQTLQVII